MKQTKSSAGSKTQPFLLSPSATYTRKNGVVVEIYNRLEAALTKVNLTNDSIVYHGTSREFTRFAVAPRKSNTPIDEVDAFFFTPDVVNAYNHASRSAREKGGKRRIIAAKLNFNKLQDVTAKVKRYQREMGNFGKAKRRAYAEVDRSKYDGIEFRGDSVNTPEYVVFNPDIIKVIDPQFTGNKIEAKDSQYGYWFTHEGQVVPVGDYRHDMEAAKIITKDYAEQFEIFNKSRTGRETYKDAAFKHFGWIRTVNETYGISIEACPGNVSPKAFTAFRSYLKDQEFETLILGWSSSKNPGTIEENYGRSTKVLAALYKNKAADGTELEAADPYGYWIDSQGGLNEVGYEDHFGYLLKHHPAMKKVHYPDPTSAYIRAFESGWIRIVNEGGEIGINFMTGRLSSSAFKTLNRVLTKELLADKYYVDIERYQKQPLPNGIQRWTYFDADSINKMMHFISKHVTRELVADDAYGYWITSDGKMLEVEFQSHNTVAEKYIVKHLYTEYFNFVMKHDKQDFNTFCFTQGWIRVVLLRTMLSIEIMNKNVSNSAARQLMRYMDKEPLDRALVDVNALVQNDFMHHTSKSFDFESNAERRAFSTFIRSHVGNVLEARSDDVYGYWITDAGELLKVEDADQGHVGVFLKYIRPADKKALYTSNEIEDMKDLNYWAVLSKGWIRIVFEGFHQMNIEIARNSVSRKAFSRFTSLLRTVDANGMYLDINIDKNLHNMESEGFSKKHELVRVLEQNVIRQTIEASYEPYGYWITPEGKTLEVADGQHGAVLENSLKQTNYEFKGNDIRVLNHGYYWFAMEKGWIRIVLEDNGYVNVEITKNSLTSRSIQTFIKLFVKFKDKEFIVDIGSNEGNGNDWKSNGGYTINTNTVSKAEAINLLKSNRRKTNLEASTSEPYFTMQARREVNDEADNRLSRTTLIMMKPSDFLKMAEPAFSKEKYEKAKQLNKDRIQYNSIPFLIFENNGDGTATVIGHEGRHRSMILKELGDRPMPVAFKSSGGKGGSIRWGNQDGHDKVEVWPKVLIGEGANGSNRIAFPQSEYYPYKLEALDESDDTFESWITDKTIVPSTHSHLRTLKSIVFKKGGEEYKRQLAVINPREEFNSNNDAYRFATRQLGFIRVVGSPTRPSIMISKDCVDPNAFKQLVKYFRDRVEPDTLIFVDILKYHDETNHTAMTDFNEVKKLNDLFTLVRKNVKKDKEIVAIDGENNIQWTGTEVVLETWQTGKGYERIDLVQQNTDYIVRHFDAEGKLLEDMPWRFKETASDYLREKVEQMQSQNVFYTRLSDLRELEAADDEKVLERWESPDGRYATVFGEQGKGFVIKDYMKNALTQAFHVVSAFTMSGKSKPEAHAEFTKHLRDLGGQFKKVDATKAFATPKEVKKLDTAQVKVRGNSAVKIADGFKLFSKQPNVRGLQVVVKKVGSNTYAKILHEASGLAVLSLTSHPIGFSPTELVERINESDLAQYNWDQPKEGLFNRYGDKALLRVAQEFYTSLSAKKQDATDKALEQGLKAWVKDYLIARFMAQPVNAKAIKRNIDREIETKGLDKTRVYLYYGDPDDRTKKGRDEVLRNIGMVRSSKGYELIKRETAKPVEQVVKKPTRDDLLNTKIARQREDRRAASVESINVPVKSGTAKDSMVGQYVVGYSGKTEYRGIVLKQVYDKKTGRSSGEVVVLTHEGDLKSATVQNLSNLKRTLKKPPQSLVSAFNIISARKRLEAALTPDAKARLKTMNRSPNRQQNIRYSLRLEPGQYVSGQYIGFRGMPTKVKGILIVESAVKNNNIASGGVLIMKRDGNFEVRDTTHLERLFLKPPRELQKQFDKLKSEGRIPALKDFQ